MTDARTLRNATVPLVLAAVAGCAQSGPLLSHQAALGTLGLYGPRAWEALRAVFRPRSGGELPAEPVAGRFWLGRVGREVADEAVAAVKQAGPVPWLEVHGHGGREVARTDGHPRW